MARFLAYCFFLVAFPLASLGNLWFTFGLWPRSWGWFATFVAISIALTYAYVELRDE